MLARLTVLTTLVLAAGIGAAAPAAASLDECLNPPKITNDNSPVTPVLTNVPLRVPIEVWGPGDWLHCSTMTASVQKADGSNATTATLDQDGGRSMPPYWSKAGFLTVPVATGAGDWVITKLSHGEESIAVKVPFRVYRGSVVNLGQPATTSGATKTVVNGLVRHYSATGALVPSAGALVKLVHHNRTQVVATDKTDANGRFSVAVPFTRTTTLYGLTPASALYATAESTEVTAHKLMTMGPLTAAAVGYVHTYWRVSGTAFPGTVSTALDVWNGSAWESTQSFGPTAANGSFTRWWKPNRTGTFRLRVTVYGSPLDNSPLSRQVSVTVRQLPQQPTYLSGVTAPTANEPARTNTTMSTYGHLQVRRADGSRGPLANQLVLIMVQRPGDSFWRPAAEGRTTSTGYYYTNWQVPFQAGESVKVLASYTTALPNAASTSAVVGTFAVQP